MALHSRALWLVNMAGDLHNSRHVSLAFFKSVLPVLNYIHFIFNMNYISYLNNLSVLLSK